MRVLSKEFEKHLDLIINCESQSKINDSAKALASKLIKNGASESYEELLEMLGYHEVKVKKIEKVKK